MLDTLFVLELLALGVLLFLSGFFSGSETALISLNKIRVRHMVEEGIKNAEVVDGLLKQPNRLLATILVGNNIVNIAAAAIATSIAIQLFHSWGVAIATGTMTFFVLVFGEITPKSLATRNAERVSLFAARPIAFLVKVLYPIVAVLVSITKPVVERFGGELRFTTLITEEELKMLVEVGEEEGVIEKEEKEMIHGIFEFGDRAASEIMAPRIDIIGIEANASVGEANDLVLKSGHSRLPVYEKSIDDIIGIVHARDLLRALKEKKGLKDILRPAYYVPETKKLDDLLKELRERKAQLAIVADEYGGTAGLVTVEDILEEIVGEILDEYDVEEIPIKELDESTAIVDARFNIKDLNEVLDLELPEEEFDTIGGLVFNAIGKVPVTGEKVEINGVVLSVERMWGRRITRVRVRKQKQEEGLS